MIHAAQRLRPAADFRSPAKASGVIVAVGLHALAIGFLLQLEPVRSALTQAAPIMVRLVALSPKLDKPDEPPKPLPAKPRVERPKPMAKPPIMTAVIEAPAPVVAPPPPPEPIVEAPSVAVAAALPQAAPARPAPPAPA